jgi:hypothetical protein
MATEILSHFSFDKDMMVVKELEITDQETVLFFKDLGIK